MQEVFGEKDAIIARISMTVKNLIQGNSLFRELDKDEMNQLLSTLL